MALKFKSVDIPGLLALVLAGDTWGAGKAWARTHLVREYPVLR